MPSRVCLQNSKVDIFAKVAGKFKNQYTRQLVKGNCKLILKLDDALLTCVQQRRRSEFKWSGAKFQKIFMILQKHF